MRVERAPLCEILTSETANVLFWDKVKRESGGLLTQTARKQLNSSRTPGF